MKNNSLSRERNVKKTLTIVFAVICVVYVLPVFFVFLNSFKLNTFVKTDTFAWPTGESAAGFSNYVKGVTFGNYPFIKSAVYSLTKTLAAELAPYGIRVNGFIPGVIQTGMTRAVVDEKGDQLVNQIALHRLGQPDDVARAIAFLASDAASYLTGTFVEISGGKLCVQNPDYGYKKLEKENG